MLFLLVEKRLRTSELWMNHLKQQSFFHLPCLVSILNVSSLESTIHRYYFPLVIALIEVRVELIKISLVYDLELDLKLTALEID